MIEVFVPGKLRNPLNGSWGGWRKHARLAKDWRERTEHHLLAAVRADPVMSHPGVKKQVTFCAHVGHLWDSDNLPGALKPVRDGVARMCCGGNDGPTSGHEWIYLQQIDRQRRGVSIRIEARDA